jgi:hypothetical protein
MDFVLYSPIFLSIGGYIYYMKNKDKVIDYDDIELLDNDYDGDCPTIFFDNNGNYYYVYK